MNFEYFSAKIEALKKNNFGITTTGSCMLCLYSCMLFSQYNYIKSLKYDFLTKHCMKQNMIYMKLIDENLMK
jgi:hypothetical protein